MKISAEDVRHVALLARLRLTSDEETRLVAELDAILAYVEKLRELDTEGTPPTSHAIDLDTAWRRDEVSNRAAVEPLLGNAPDRSGNFFKVPKILE